MQWLPDILSFTLRLVGKEIIPWSHSNMHRLTRSASSFATISGGHGHGGSAIFPSVSQKPIKHKLYIKSQLSPGSKKTDRYSQERYLCYDAYGTEVYVPKYLDSVDTIEAFLAQYDTLLIDCDGVLYGADHFTRFSGIQQAINRLRLAGKMLLFVTNNSMHARDAYVEKFKNLAAFDVEVADIYSVPYAAAIYMKEIAHVKGKCYIIGSKGMQRELELIGIPTIGMGPDLSPMSDYKDDLIKQVIDSDVDSVLAGFDIHFSYNKLFKAASYLNNPGCHFVATNDHETKVQIGPRHVQPLAGAILQSISATSPRPPVVIGKPYKHLMDCIRTGHPKLNLHRTVMIGDALKTDITFANNVGIDSVLVMSGATSSSDLQSNYKYKQCPLPTYVMSSFAKFGEC